MWSAIPSGALSGMWYSLLIATTKKVFNAKSPNVVSLQPRYA